MSSSCLSLPSAGITAMYHYGWLACTFLFKLDYIYNIVASICPVLAFPAPLCQRSPVYCFVFLSSKWRGNIWKQMDSTDRLQPVGRGFWDEGTRPHPLFNGILLGEM